MQKYNEALVEEVRSGKLAIENTGDKDQLRELVKYIFPEDVGEVHGIAKFYEQVGGSTKLWSSSHKTILPSKPVSDFFLPNTTVKDSVAEQGAKGNEGTALYPLFKFFSDTHNLILLDSEIELIIDTIINFEQMRKQIVGASQYNKMGTGKNSLNFEVFAPVDFDSHEMKKAIAKIKLEIAEIMEAAKVDTSKLHITFR